MRLMRLALVLLLASVVPVWAREPRTIKLAFPKVEVPAGSNVELCAFIRIPATSDYDLQSFKLVHRNGKNGLVVHHFLVYAYMGDQLAGFDDALDRVVASRGCLDLGPPDRDHRQLIAAGSAPVNDGALPAGVSRLVPAVPEAPSGAPVALGILLDGNWENSGGKAQRPRARLVLKRAKKGAVKRRALPLFDRAAESTLLVPPGSIGVTMAEWGPGIVGDGDPGPTGDACLRVVSGHFHERGRYFAVDRIGASGQVDNPSVDSTPNPYDPGVEYLFGTADFSDPGARTFRTPLLIRAGEKLRYRCWVDNGVATIARLGCEETIGVPPGDPIAGPAKPCAITGPASPDCPATDPAYPDRVFTGACVDANAVAGTTPDDEVCQLVGAWYDAVPGAAPADACNVGSLPPIN